MRAGDVPEQGDAGKRRTYATTTDGLFALLEWLSSQGCRLVALEATGVYWLPVWKILSPGEPRHLADAAHIKAVSGRKTDMKDAMWIADFAAHGLIKASVVPGEDARPTHTDANAQAVGARTDAACSTHPGDADERTFASIRRSGCVHGH